MKAGRLSVAPKRWMFMVWGGILAALIGIAAIEGAHNCEVPKSDPFRWLLKGRTFVPTTSGKIACREVK